MPGQPGNIKYITRLLVKLMPKGVVFSFLFIVGARPTVTDHSFVLLQPHPASEAAAAVVVASGAKTTVAMPRAKGHDDLTDGADTYVDSWTNEPVFPTTRVTMVHGQAPPRPLARQQTFGRVSSCPLYPLVQSHPAHGSSFQALSGLPGCIMMCSCH